MLVKNCYVTNGAEFSFQVIDARGCPLLTPLIQGEVQYNSELNLAFATVSAYAFPDASLLNFQCQIQVCSKREDACTGITVSHFIFFIELQKFIPNNFMQN